MKFGQFMAYSKRNNFMKKVFKNCILKTSSRLFCISKELILENQIFEAIYLYYTFNSKAIKISPTSAQATFFVRFCL